MSEKCLGIHRVHRCSESVRKVFAYPKDIWTVSERCLRACIHMYLIHAYIAESVGV